MQGADVSLRSLFNPHPRQVEYIHASDECRYPLFGGARGPGKSYGERWRQIRFLLLLTARGLRYVQTGLFSQTYKESRKRQFLPAKAEFPEWLGSFNESNLEFTFGKEWGGHRLAFLNLGDLSQYKSEQFATIGIEELTLCPNPLEVIDTLSGSLRWPGVEWTPLCATTNPDGPGHSEVKRIWVTGDFTRPEDAKRDPSQYRFVRALPTDNPHLPEAYITEVLERLPPSLRKPWLEGSWDLFEGQRFELNRRVHVKDPEPLSHFEPCKFYRSIDYGFFNPFACGWYVVYADDGGRTRVRKIGEKVLSGLKVHQQIKCIHEFTEELGLTGRIETSYLDTACWKEEDDGLSIADKFIQGGIPVVQALKDRATGWVGVEYFLFYETDKDGVVTLEPILTFASTCPITVQQITDATWDPKRPGDIQHPEGFRDDALDETRYFVLTHFQPPKQNSEKTHDEDMRERWRIMTKGK